MSDFHSHPPKSSLPGQDDSQVNHTQYPVIESENISNTRSDFRRFLAIVSAVGLLIGMLLFGNGFSVITITLSSIAVIIMALCWRYPRQGLWAFLIYLPFAGTISYGIGNDHFLFHLAKDGLYIPALIGLIFELRKKKLPLINPPQLKIPLLILFLIAIVTLIAVNGVLQKHATPDNQPFAVGLFGLKVLIGYIPLITCGYYLIRHRQDLEFLTRLQVILILICCILGLIQFGLVVSGYCPDNSGLPENLLLRANVQRKCLVGGSLGYLPAQNFIRLPGTFVAPWHWAWFLVSSTFFCFATAFSDPKLTWRLMGLGTLSLVILNAIVSGQRTALLAVPSIVILLIIFTSHISRIKRVLVIILGMFIFMMGTWILAPEVMTERVDSFIGRWNADPPAVFLTKQTNLSLKAHRGFLGNGLGEATTSARGLGKTRLVEAYYPKLLYEIGPFGVAAFLFLVTNITILGFKSYHQLQDHSLWGYGIIFWIFIVLISYNPYWYPLDTDPVAVYYWFLVGVLLKLPKIQKQEQEKDQLEAPLDP
ncbi:MAG TPA: hypothetical protein DCQ51_10230 [Planktothrix sp. UBA8407]|jgi:hypothetical protein|nr:hypothetical protein [Planktothrix sp. UBA8402]HAO11526.1 hypothetical protein [Planktothrix sp. UBA8407]HBK22769.1 hypothetical protein [Planktothrix sp. UBA10369]